MYVCITGPAAKEQWRKLRECHRDALRRQKRKSANPGYAPRMWTFQKEMEFLLAYMGNRSIQTYNTEDFISEVTAEESFHEEEEEDLQEDPDDQSTHEVDPFDVTIKEELISTEPVIKRKKSDLNSLMKETLKEYGQRSREREIDRKQILEDKLMNDPERNDALHQFFMSMYHTTKSMPKHVQIQIRKAVFETVTKVEEDLLLTNQ